MLWFFLKSNPTQHDWKHEVSIHTLKPESNKEDDWTGICEIRNISDDVKQVHVLYHYHDNYSDYSVFYTDRQEAEIEFWKRNKCQLNSLKETWAAWESNYICAVHYEDKLTISSTIYERDMNKISYPDKGDRWVLVTVDVTVDVPVVDLKGTDSSKNNETTQEDVGY